MTQRSNRTGRGGGHWGAPRCSRARRALPRSCEGCEFSLYRDTMKTSPRFFEGVDQFALEAHISRRWAPDRATFLEYGRLLALLRRAGLRVYDVSTGWCSNGEQMGIVPFAAESGYFRRRGGHCENILFARSAHRVPGAVERWPMLD